LIADYDPNGELNGYVEACIDEKFTENQANQLKAYLDQNTDHTVSIKECELPVPNNSCGLSAIAVGGLEDYCGLRWCSGNTDPSVLPFEVEGYYDLEGLERVEGHFTTDRDRSKTG
jgi:hypothetical protein